MLRVAKPTPMRGSSLFNVHPLLCRVHPTEQESKAQSCLCEMYFSRIYSWHIISRDPSGIHCSYWDLVQNSCSTEKSYTHHLGYPERAAATSSGTPHGRDLGFHQAEEEVSSLCSVLLCLETPSKRQRMDLCMDLLSRNEMVMGGSPELLFTQPLTDAIHKEGSCSSNLPCIFNSTLSLESPQPHPGALIAFREPPALR